MQIRGKVSARSAILAVGFAALGAGPALPGTASTGGPGPHPGDQTGVPVSAPIAASGDADRVGGVPTVRPGGTTALAGPEGTNGLGGSCDGVPAIFGSAYAGCLGSRQQAGVPVAVPISLCGTRAAVLEAAVARCPAGDGRPPAHAPGPVLSRTPAETPVSMSARVCGNAVAVLGEFSALCVAGPFTFGGTGTDARAVPTPPGTVGGDRTGAPTPAPESICGDAVAVLGSAAAGCVGGPLPGSLAGSGHGHRHPHGGRETPDAQIPPTAPGEPRPGLEPPSRSGSRVPPQPEGPAAPKPPELPVRADETALRPSGPPQAEASRLPMFPELPGAPRLPLKTVPLQGSGLPTLPQVDEPTAIDPASALPVLPRLPAGGSRPSAGPKTAGAPETPAGPRREGARATERAGDHAASMPRTVGPGGTAHSAPVLRVLPLFGTLPVKPQRSADPVTPPRRSRHAPETPVHVPAGLPDLPELPVTRAVAAPESVTPAASVATSTASVPTPASVATAGQPPGEAGGRVDAITGGLGDVPQLTGSEPLLSGSGIGAPWVFAAVIALAGLSGLLAVRRSHPRP